MIELDPQTRSYVEDTFKKMEDPVRLVFFSGPNCQYCNEIKEILETVKSLAPEGKIILEEHEFEKEKELASVLKVDKYPATVIKAGKKLVHFYGLMSGYEFGTIIEDIMDLSTGNLELSENSLNFLEKLNSEIRLQVFVTPTCPYCPRMVRLAHKFAMANPAKITGDGVEAIEFPELSNLYQVSGVPKTIITVDGEDKDAVVGAVPEEYLLEKLKQAI